MAEQKNGERVIVVLGATGAQGGAVVRSLIKDGQFKVRALTRDDTKEVAKKLSAQGVEVVKGDYTNVNDLDSVFKGAYGVFALTNFWDPATADKEELYGKQVVDAAKRAGVQHFTFHTLPYVSVISGGKYQHVAHFDLKAKVELYSRSQGFKYHTYFSLSFYYGNFASFFPPTLSGDEYVFTLPMLGTDVLYATDPADLGDAVLGAFKNPTAWTNETVNVIGEKQPLSKYIESIGKASGKKVKLNSVPTQVFASFGFPGAQEMAEMFGFYSDFTFFGNESGTDTRSGAKAAGRALTTFDEFLAANPPKLA